MTIEEQIKTEAAALQRRWETDPRWTGIERPYTAEEVVRLRGKIRDSHGFATQAAERLAGVSVAVSKDVSNFLNCPEGGDNPLSLALAGVWIEWRGLGRKPV